MRPTRRILPSILDGNASQRRHTVRLGRLPPARGLVVIHNRRDPIRLADGEQDGAVSDATKAETDPIRLVRMVKEIDPLREVRPHSRRISFTNGTIPLGSEKDVYSNE